MRSSPLPAGPTGPPDLEGRVKRIAVPAVLAVSVAVGLLLWVLKPIPHAYRYDLALTLPLALALVWALYLAPPAWVFKKAVLAFVLVLGVGLGLRVLLTPDFNLELVRHYESVFKTMDAGGNPYTSGTIFHMGEGGRVVYGNFNYPPMEIYPYYLAYRLAGRWNSVVFTAAMVFLNALACLAFALMFPGVRRRYLLPYFLVFLFLEVKTNPAMTFLVTALVLLLARRGELRPRPGRRYAIAVLFGVGLLTKFLIIPLMAAYYWHGFDRRDLRSLGRVAVDSGIAVATATLLMLPFGAGAVLKNTILFNLVMKDRAALATFYPNALSGPLSWLHLAGLYPFAAVALLGLAVLAAPRLKLHTALLAAAYAFLLVATTPEPQYLAILLFIVLAGQCAALEDEGPMPPGVWKRPPEPTPRTLS